MPQSRAVNKYPLGVRREDLSNGPNMTTEDTITTSVDDDVLSLDEQIAALQAERTTLAGKQSEERAEQQRAKFDEIIGGPRQILDATGIDLDALKAIGVIGFSLTVKLDPDGGPDVTSVAPVTAVPVKATRVASSNSGKPSRDLQGNFDTNATAEDKANMAVIVEAGADGNKVYALRLKVWNRVNPS